MRKTTECMETKDVNSRLIDMTLAEAIDLARPMLEKIMAKVVQDNLEGKGADEYGEGLQAICDVFGCCKSTAVQIHGMPCYQPAFRQDGIRRFSVNKTQLRKLREQEQMKRIKKGLI